MQEILKKMGDYVLAQMANHKKAVLLFICTHNSRRSQMEQAWGMTAAEYYGLYSVVFFSGGSEAIAFNPRAAEVLKLADFNYSKSEGNLKNPNYLVSNKRDASAWIMYAKKYRDNQNPQSEFAGIMVCPEADKSSPMAQRKEYHCLMTTINIMTIRLQKS